MASDEQLFARALEAIREDEELSDELLGALAHLDVSEVDALRPAWNGLPAGQRLRLLARLHGTEQENLRRDFNAVYRLGQEDADPAVRRAAVESIVEDRSTRGHEPLIRLLTEDEDAGVREAAARALGPFALRAELGEVPGHVRMELERALVSALHRDGEGIGPRREALATVGYLDGEQTAEEIRRAYADPQLRLSAVKAMGRTANPDWLDTLSREMASDDPTMRAEAARAGGEMGDERAVETLTDLLDDPVIEVRLAAIEGLGEIGGDEAREALIYALEDKREVVREAADEALSKLAFGDDPLAV